jgi:uncharacterized protein YcgL (UPF0745 family)
LGIGSGRMGQEKRGKYKSRGQKMVLFRQGEIYEERRENQNDRVEWERTKRTIESNGFYVQMNVDESVKKS